MGQEMLKRYNRLSCGKRSEIEDMMITVIKHHNYIIIYSYTVHVR